MSFTEQFWSMIERKENDAVKFILEDSRFYHALGINNRTLLHYSAGFGNIEITKYLLDKKFKIDVQDYTGHTPLMFAVENRQYAIVKILVAAGADIKINSFSCENVLDIALYFYPLPGILLHLFIAYRKQYNSEEIAKKLIRAKCKMNYAAYSKDARIIEFMIKKGVQIECKVESPLHVAINHIDIKMVKILLKYGANVDAVDDFGATPLFYCYKYTSKPVKHYRKRLKILKMLLSKGVSLTSCTDDEEFNVRPALSVGCYEAIRAILQSNIDFTATEGPGGVTLLHILMCNKNPGVVDEIKPYINNFDINARDEYGYTPLHAAVSSANIVMVKYLLNLGVKVDGEALREAYVSDARRYRDRGSNPDRDAIEDQCAELILQQNVDPEVIFTVPNGAGVTIVDGVIENKRCHRIKLSLAQLATREMQGISVTEFTSSKIDSYRPFKNYFSKCRRLLRRKISGSVTIFKLLTADEKNMTRYLKNKELVKKLVRLSRKKNLKPWFLYYYRTLTRRFSTEMVNRMLRKKMAEVICEISCDLLDLNNVAVEKVISYLNGQDLRKSYQLFDNN